MSHRSCVNPGEGDTRLVILGIVASFTSMAMLA
jgi:hypothetical protein